MAPITLEGLTLGERHKNLNSQVNEAIQQDIRIENIFSERLDTDVDHLYQIDIASHYRNVEYIIEVLKCEDMLYVSRAIKKCPWLITDQQYAHLINPQHLHTHLFPHMTTKAINKLLLNIRLYLKDEKRGDQFFNYFIDKDYKIALKWLPNCSLDIIEKALFNYYIEYNIAKKIFERKPEFFDIFVTKSDVRYHYKEFLENSMFFLNAQTDKYLDLVEKCSGWCWPKFNKRHTAILMKRCPERIINKFGKYHSVVDIDTVAKYLEPNNILPFLVSISEDVNLRSWFTHSNIKPFIKYLPKECKFYIVKSVFINKSRIINIDDDSIGISEHFLNIVKSDKLYNWYEHAPFDIAFPELKRIIKSGSSPEERVSIMDVMLKTAAPDEDNVLKVLQYYHEKHINEPFRFKMTFINSLLTVSHPHKYNKASWKLLNELFQSCEVYMESENDVQRIIEVIIVYNLLNSQPIPDIIRKKFKFNSLKSVKKTLNQSEKEKVFEYICNCLEDNYKTSGDNDEANIYIENVINVLSDWEKQINNFPDILCNIENLIDLQGEENDYINHELIYNKNKALQKALFERSLLLSRSEQTYLNVLKHNPTLFQKYLKEVNAVICDDSIVLGKFLTKLRTYCNNSIAEDWANAYRSLFNEGKTSTSVIKGLCAILPREELLVLIQKYTPIEDKIEWNNIEEHSFSLKKKIAQLMYNIRPHPPPNNILAYAHGDYLQYAMPSVYAIFYNISSNKMSKYLNPLLNGPVSLQKYGLRKAFEKLKSHEIRELYCNVWNRVDNISIRAVIFQKTFDLLSKENSKSEIIELWSLLEMFIDSLSEEEDPKVYKLLGDSKKLPKEVMGKFCIKSYNFFNSLPTKARYHKIIESLTQNMSHAMESIDSDFIDDLLLKFVNNETFKNNVIPNLYTTFNDYKLVLINYLLFVPTEADQRKRYEYIIKPWLHQIFALWDKFENNQHQAVLYFNDWLSRLCIAAIDNMLDKKFVIPTYVFEELEKEITLCLSFERNYNLVTTCKLMAALTKCYMNIKLVVLDAEVEDESGEQINHRYRDMWAKIVPSYTVEVVKILKEDTKNLGPFIWMIFSSCLSEIYYTPTYENDGFSLEAELLKDDTCVLSWLLALELLPLTFQSSEFKKELNEIKSTIWAKSSLEVKLHFNNKYINQPILPLDVIENYE